MNECSTDTDCGERLVIAQGERVTLTVTVIDDKTNIGKDLTGVSAIQALFPATVSGTYVKKKMTDIADPIQIVSGTSNILITLPVTSTALMKIGKKQSFFVAVDFPGSTGRKILRIDNGYDCIEAPAIS